MIKDDNYYKGLDKRTKEYKSWAKFNRLGGDVKYEHTFTVDMSKPDNIKRTEDFINKFNKESELVFSKGLGDTIEKITEATGIKKVVKKLFGDDCGCNERKDKLNKLFPYKRTIQRCLTEEQYKEYQEYQTRRTLNVWQEKDIELLIRLYSWVFAIQYNSKDLCRNCGGSGKILLRITNELDKVVSSYETK